MSESESPIFYTPGNDPENAQAAERARASFGVFFRELSWERRRIIPGLSMASVKAVFSDPPEIRAQAAQDALEVEYMWLDDVDFDGRTLTGTLLNAPHSLQTFSQGQEVSIPFRQVWDWMYVIGDEVFGGFSVDLLRSRMPLDEMKAHDAAWGLNFGRAGIVELVPKSFFGKGFFSRLFAGNKNSDLAAVLEVEHPMSVNMRESLIQAFSEHPEYLHDTDNKGFNFLHQLALAGSWDGVDACLLQGADPCKPASNGMTPKDLAASLGWKKVVERLQKAGG